MPLCPLLGLEGSSQAPVAPGLGNGTGGTGLGTGLEPEPVGTGTGRNRNRRNWSFGIELVAVRFLWVGTVWNRTEPGAS